MEIENLQGKAMDSKTSKAKKYKTKIGEATFTIIDTPGFCDTRGDAYDN